MILLHGIKYPALPKKPNFKHYQVLDDQYDHIIHRKYSIQNKTNIKFKNRS